MIRVMLVDDHPIVRDGLRRILERTSDIEIVSIASTGNEAVQIHDDREVDVILMDVSMPGMSGIEATRLIRTSRTDVKIVMLTAASDSRHVLGALDAGASGYLLKDADPAALIAGIRDAANGDAPLDPRAARVLLAARREADQPNLTDREQQVLWLVRDGLTNKAIAAELAISEKTVKTHLTKVFSTLGVAGRTQAALWAKENLRTECRSRP